MSLFEDVLKDDKNFPDTLELPIGDKKISLAELRSFTKAQQQRVADEMTAAQQTRQLAVRDSEKAAEVLANLQKLQEDASKAVKVAPDANDDFDTSEWWNPVRKRLSPLEKQYAETQKAIETLTNSLSRAATIFAEDRWDREFESGADRLKKNKQYADWDQPKVREYAVQNKLVDRHGFPSVSKAIQELTKADELELARQKAREEGLQEGLQRARMSTMSRPTSHSGKRSAGAVIDPTKNLEDLGDAVMDDPELTKMLADLGTLTPTDIQ